jgi:exopolysaccharide production protein ExoQ
MRTKRISRGTGFELAGKPAVTPVGASERANASQWLLCFASLTLLVLQPTAYYYLPLPGAATVVIFLFMALSGFIALRQPNIALGGIVHNWPLLALPAMAMISAAWSDYPAWSLRAGTQYLVTTIMGVILGSCVKPRAWLSALFLALALVTVLSVFFGAVQGGTPVGLFGSKNYYGFVVALLLFVALTIFFDRSQPRVLRIVGLAAAGLAPLVLVSSRSTGALVNAIAVVGIMGMLEFATKLEVKFRVIVLAFLGLVVFQFLIISWMFADELNEVLNFFGKDLTLTGRTKLWEIAYGSIADHPIIGLGYQAFWQVGNWKAEYLWVISFQQIGSGFHFHNTYLAVAVDLGVIGLFAFISMIVVVMGRIGLILTYLRPNPAQKLSIACFVFFLLRTPIEVDLFYQFTISTILMSLIWINTKIPRKFIQSRRAAVGELARALSDNNRR